MEILKDKYTWLALMVIVLGGGYLLQESSSSVHENAPEEMVQTEDANSGKRTPLRDLEIIEGRLSQDVLNDGENQNLWGLLNQYNKKPNEVIDRSNAKQMLPLGQTVISDLLKCLDVDFCGMEKDSEEDPYFDPTGTVAHRTIERSLELMIAATKVDPELQADLNVALLERVADIPSERIQSLVTELLPEGIALNSNGNSGDLNEKQDEIKKVEAALEKSTTGKARTSLLIKLSKDKKTDREELVSMLKKTFSEADVYTVVNVVENLKSMNLSEDELAKTTVYLCRFKIDEYEHNWKAVKKNVEKVFPEFTKVCNE